MIGWLNEINRLASKGKREHREPRCPLSPQPSDLVPSQGTGLPAPALGCSGFYKELGDKTPGRIQ